MNVLVSAGPTRERIDPVRFISNRSSGKMGYALAAGLAERGHAVTLVSGPVAIESPPGVKCIMVESADEMYREVMAIAGAMDLVIMSAAVADYRPIQIYEGKMKKSSGNLTIELERTMDILASLGAAKQSGQVLVGFAAETDNVLGYAREKLVKKNLDWIVANDISLPDRGFAVDQNAVTMISRDGSIVELELDSKESIAGKIIDIILKQCDN